MYAIVSLAGKQTILELGAIIDTDHVNAEVGAVLEINEVLSYHDGKAIKIGQPLLDKYTVKAKVLDHGKDKKIRVVHFKRRQNHLKWQGSRAHFTKLQIIEFKGPGVNEVFSEPKSEKKKVATEKAVSADKKVAPKAEKAVKKSAPKSEKVVKKSATKAEKAVKKPAVKKSDSESKDKA